MLGKTHSLAQDKRHQEKKIGLFGYMYKLENYYYETSNEGIKQELYSINNTLEKIIDNSNSSEVKSKILNDLENYHLPAICKVINEYERLQRNIPDSETEDNFESEVKSFLKQMKLGFNKQLEAMLSDNIQDAKLEMNYIKTLLKSDGFLDDDFV